MKNFATIFLLLFSALLMAQKPFINDLIPDASICNGKGVLVNETSDGNITVRATLDTGTYNQSKTPLFTSEIEGTYDHPHPNPQKIDMNDPHVVFYGSDGKVYFGHYNTTHYDNKNVMWYFPNFKSAAQFVKTISDTVKVSKNNGVATIVATNQGNVFYKKIEKPSGSSVRKYTDDSGSICKFWIKSKGKDHEEFSFWRFPETPEHGAFQKWGGDKKVCRYFDSGSDMSIVQGIDFIYLVSWAAGTIMDLNTGEVFE